MDAAILLRSAGALAVIMLLLAAFERVARAVAARRSAFPLGPARRWPAALRASLRPSSAERPVLEVIASSALTPHASVHVVRIADRYLALGVGAGVPVVLAELANEPVAGGASARVS